MTNSLDNSSDVLRQRDIWIMLAPLAVVPFVDTFARLLISKLLAGTPTAVDELAGMGLGFGVIFMLMSATFHVDQAALSFGDNRRAFRRVMWATLVLSGSLGLVALTIGLIPPVTHAALVVVQRSPDTATASRAAFIITGFAPYIALFALQRAIRGALIRAHRTHWVSSVSIVARLLSITAAFIAIRLDFVLQRPLWLPIIVGYVDGVTRIVLFAPVVLRVVLPQLPEEGDAPRARDLLHFQYPLMITAFMMAFSRPIINRFLGPMVDGKESLAALEIIFPLSALFIMWLGDLRVLPTAFQHKRQTLRAIRLYVVYVSAAIFALSVLLYATPLSVVILKRVMNVPDELVWPCRVALVCTCLWPLAIATRGYFQGVAISLRQTRAMTWSGPARVTLIFASMWLMSFWGIPGAAMGALAMLAGFSTEAVVVSFFLRRINGAGRREEEVVNKGEHPKAEVGAAG